jgi:hypothetical protein
MRGILFSRWVLVTALAVGYGTVGLGCGHEHHDDDYNRAAYHDRGYSHDHDYDHHDWDHHDYDRDRY